jgi:CHAD domain-containing protein
VTQAGELRAVRRLRKAERAGKSAGNAKRAKRNRALPGRGTNSELAAIRKLANALRANLAKCAGDPNVDTVHDTRTGTRRLQATLENVVRETAEGASGDAVRDAAQAFMRQLKRIRRAAGAVRDLDVHRKLVEKVAELAPSAGSERHGASTRTALVQAPGRPDLVETPEASLRTGGLPKQADDLDAWLKHQRVAQAERLKTLAPKLLAKFDKRRIDLESAMLRHPAKRRTTAPAVLALDTFARLANEMQFLDGVNLHDFRKGAKKARYVAELAAGADSHAGAVGKTLKKLQDEIGDWHDWLVLADEAHAALDAAGAAELIGKVEAKREEHFVAAMKTASKLRGRLMGEWLAAGRRARGRASGRGTPAAATMAAKPRRRAAPEQKKIAQQ